MANYLPEQLRGNGVINEELTGTKTFTFSNPSSSAYFVFEGIKNNLGVYETSSLPIGSGVINNFTGNFQNLSSIPFSLINSQYVISMVIPEGNSSFDFTPSNIGEESGILETTLDSLLDSFVSVSASTQDLVNIGTTGSNSGVGATISCTLDTTTSISTVTVINGGSGYIVGENLSVFSGSMVSGSADLIFTLTANDIININLKSGIAYLRGTGEYSLNIT